MRVALVRAVGNGAIVVEGSEYLLHGDVEVVKAAHVEIGFLLPGEGGVRQVFRSG